MRDDVRLRIVNCAAFNTRAEGDEHWFPTKAERNAALASFRETAVEAGLAASSAKAGIYPVRRHVASDSGSEWLRVLMDGMSQVGVRWEGGIE